MFGRLTTNTYPQPAVPAQPMPDYQRLRGRIITLEDTVDALSNRLAVLENSLECLRCHLTDQQLLPELLSTEQVAALIGCVPNTVLRLRKSGKLPPSVFYSSKMVRWTRESVVAYLESLKAPHPA